MTTLLDVRSDLAEAISTMVGDSVLVYAYPAETIALPAVVVVPDEPWWQPSKLGQTATAGVRVNFELQLIVPRTEVELGFGDLEELALAVALAISTSPVFRWVDLSQPTTVEINEIPALMSGVAITTTI